MTFLELAEKVLREEKKALTAIEIWNIASNKGYDKQLNSEGKTPWATLGAQIYVSSKDDAKSKFAKTDSRPKMFYLKSMANDIDLEDISLPEDIVVDKKKKLRTKKQNNFANKSMWQFIL